MISLVGAIKCQFKAPPELHDLVQVSTTSTLTDQESRCLGYALVLLMDAVKRDGLRIDVIRPSIMFVDSDCISITSLSPCTMGLSIPLIVLPLHRWRAGPRSDEFLIVVILEELCHCVYQIHDESEVKGKVTDIYRQIDPSATRARLFQFFEDPQC